jgi:hypothetical protein
MKLLVAIFSFISCYLASPTPTVPPSTISTTDTLLFGDSLSQFLAIRNSPNRPTVVYWVSDGCSHAPANPLNFPFVNACYRHDFGYK